MTAEVLSNTKKSHNHYAMEIICHDFVEAITPGQFIMLKIKKGYESLLRRPFSFAGIKQSNGSTLFKILYKVVGKGTRLMADLKSADRIDIIAPLGSGFSWDSDIQTAVIVAGGIGIAPLLFLVETLNKSTKNSIEIVFLYGARGKADMLNVDHLTDIVWDVRICTEDGSVGCRAMVTELLEDYLTEREKSTYERRSVAIFSSGPREMLRSVAQISKRFDIFCKVSLEEYMACGFGACLGCVVKVLSDDNTRMDYERVCAEGPVFNSERIIWHDE